MGSPGFKTFIEVIVQLYICYINDNGNDINRNTNQRFHSKIKKKYQTGKQTLNNIL